MPGLQPSMEAGLRAAIAHHSRQLHAPAGAPLCLEGSAAHSVLLLVQGQVLVAKQLDADAIVTEGQVGGAEGWGGGSLLSGARFFPQSGWMPSIESIGSIMLHSLCLTHT